MRRPLTIKEEANAITCWAVRHSYLEELHAGKHSALLEILGLSRITDSEMEKLMIGISAKVAEILKMERTNPIKYWQNIVFFYENYCRHWAK